MGVFAVCSLVRLKLVGEVSFFGGELALPFRVARVSRLIGKSDTTANRHCWQVRFWGRLPAKSSIGAPGSPKCKKRHSIWSGASLSCAGHWPPKSSCGRWLSPPCLLQTSRPVHPFWGPLRWRLLLPGACCALGWQESLQQPVHHWRLGCSNRHAVRDVIIFQSLARRDT